MTGYQGDAFDPYEEMHAFYRQDDPIEEQQFRFVEAMRMLIDEAVWESDIVAFSYNLAIYYRDIKAFGLEKKYLELGAQYDSDLHKEELGLLWYYGLGVEQDFEKAYHYFLECGERRSQYMISDMYRDGSYVQQNRRKSRKIIEGLFKQVEVEKDEPMFALSTLFPEIALRLIRLNYEDGAANNYDWNTLLDARIILTKRQESRPFWGNIHTMQDILNLMIKMRDFDYGLLDLYDLLTLNVQKATVSFEYNEKEYKLDIFQHEGETIYQLGGRWYHGALDFLEKARIEGKRATTVMTLIENIKLSKNYFDT